jgi:hypothetical protein
MAKSQAKSHPVIIKSCLKRVDSGASDLDAEQSMCPSKFPQLIFPWCNKRWKSPLIDGKKELLEPNEKYLTTEYLRGVKLAKAVSKADTDVPYYKVKPAGNREMGYQRWAEFISPQNIYRGRNRDAIENFKLDEEVRNQYKTAVVKVLRRAAREDSNTVSTVNKTSDKPEGEGDEGLPDQEYGSTRTVDKRSSPPARLGLSRRSRVSQTIA